MIIRKFHPTLRRILQDRDKVAIQLGPESEMKELWDASNPDMKHEPRSGEYAYPVEQWFGTIVNENGKARLVSVTGHTVRQGKEGKPYALIGGNKTHPDYRGRGLMSDARKKNLAMLGGMPKIAGYTNLGKKSFSIEEQPETHPVIPDEELDFFRDRVGKKKGVVSWSIVKGWMQILRRD